ncbi:acyltransferase family protein [Clostridium sp.]|uniref:acyltransferase family protein n=1 Tax=Clostridium sp. TaxID=1506 RepID=UPI001B5667F5|nr:acyltransferase family protein [Clostridium sp.]MBP3917174.1 acyltransferase family protein [Clostridium sp.]
MNTEIRRERSSNFELMRVIMMITIIAHHYVVNSGITERYNYSEISFNMLFLQLFGFGGKAMINGFLLITGYFTIKKKFSIEKLIKLYLEVKFYKFIIYVLMILLGVESLNIMGALKTIFSSIYDVNVGFTSTFLLLYILTPYLNKLLNSITEKQYQILIGILIFYFTIISTFSVSNNTFNEIGWYITVYMIGGYFKLYDKKIWNNKKLFSITTMVLLFAAAGSILLITLFNSITGHRLAPYYFVINAHKIIAILLAVSMFLLFKNINIKTNKVINTISLATFGVLQIHANSDSMRYFIWNKCFNVVGQYDSKYLIIHAVLTVLLIYVVCTIIDLARIKYIEEPMVKSLRKNNRYIEICSKINNIVN